MARTAINLYSVREMDAPTLDVLERVARAGYDGVQFSGGLGDATSTEVADALDDLGLTPTGAHVGIDALESDLDGVVETYDTIGTDAVVVPYLDRPAFADTEAVGATAARMNDLHDRVVDRGFALHYHNHDHEFTAIDGESAFDRFGAATSVGLELDVGWIHTAGRDPVALVERYADRVDLVHMKDMADGDFCEIGDGDVDMEACADAARDADASWLIYEHDEPSDPAASIERGAAFLREL